MGKLYLKTYQWVLRAVVELLDLFPPRRIDKNEFALRKGTLPGDFKAPDEGTIWVHGASLGEVITLRPFLKELADIYGRQRLVCTATTMDGLRQLQKDEICGFATLLPIELPAFTIPFIERVRPTVMLISETEIWPLLLDTLARKGVPYGIINGRINEKSVRMMRLAWPIFESAVSGIAFAFPQEKQYQRRFKILGIKEERQRQLGCFKYDIAESLPDTTALRRQYGIIDGRQLICFGSTHPGEEALILDALDPLWEKMDATVIIAPRHVKRVHEVEELLRERKIEFIKVSEGASSSARVILVDTMGELRNFYAISSLVFVGGSLIKRGGHNLMEPAAYARPTLTGPHTFNFRYEMMALNRARAIKTVKDSEELRQAITLWLQQPDSYSEMGARARQVLESMAGACHRTVSSLQQLGYLPHV